MENQNEMWNQKDKRISFQSLFSSLCSYYQGNAKITPEELADKAYQLNAQLHDKYPITASGNEICFTCGSQMKLIKAGVSKTTGKPYGAFWSCPNNRTQGCKTVPFNQVNDNAYPRR